MIFASMTRRSDDFETGISRVQHMFGQAGVDGMCIDGSEKR